MKKGMLQVEKRLHKYGETLLTRPRWFTFSKRKAEKSLFLYGKRGKLEYTLSLLG